MARINRNEFRRHPEVRALGAPRRTAAYLVAHPSRLAEDGSHLRMTAGNKNQPSSSGLTGRSSTPQHLDSFSGASEYWMPAFAGMTAGMRDDGQPRARTPTPC